MINRIKHGHGFVGVFTMENPFRRTQQACLNWAVPLPNWLSVHWGSFAYFQIFYNAAPTTKKGLYDCIQLYISLILFTSVMIP